MQLNLRVHSSLKASCNVATDGIATSGVPPYLAGCPESFAESADVVLELYSGEEC